MGNIQRKCKDCGTWIVLTEKDQAFYRKQKWDFPKRCRRCREKRKDPRYADANVADLMKPDLALKSSGKGKAVSRSGGNAKEIESIYLTPPKERYQWGKDK